MAAGLGGRGHGCSDRIAGGFCTAAYNGATLRHLARMTKNANRSRRLLALAEIDAGGSRSDAARIGGVGLQIVRGRLCATGPCGSMSAGRGAGLVLPFCNTDALIMPENISIIPLPAKCPELILVENIWPVENIWSVENIWPVENIWQFMRDNRLSNRIFGSCNEIVDHCCDAWNQLTCQPWRTMSIGRRQWAHEL